MKISNQLFQAAPEFEGCPDWVKPLMLCEYQVDKRSSIIPPTILMSSTCRLAIRRRGFGRSFPASPTI